MAEIEVYSHKFLELEKVNPKITSIEGKVDRIKFLLESIKTTYRLRGIRGACIAGALLIYFDKPENEIFAAPYRW